MVLGLIIGASIAYGLAKGAHSVRRGMTYEEEDEMDKEVGFEGIDSTDVMRIARRCGIRPNKKGVLPYVEPPKWVLDYVMKYSNSQKDIDEFKKNWRKTIEKQLETRREKIKTTSIDSKKYDENLQYRMNNVLPNLSSTKTKIFTVDHWMGLPKAEHKRRLNLLVNNTILGEYLAEPPVLRQNDWTIKSHTEYYKVKLNTDSKKAMADVEFNRLYRECCAKVGYEY